MRKILIAFGFGLLTTGTAIAEEQTARIEVAGLWCASCKFIAGEAMEKATSVEIVDFVPADDGESGVYTITFEDTLTSVEEIAAQPSEYGYTAVVLEVAATSS